MQEEERLKKMTAAFLAALMFCMAALGCGGLPADTPDAAGKLSIVATGFAPYDFARQIAGDHANVKMLLPPGSESHTFEPTAQDILAIAACDVFVCVGGESETWIENILDSIDTSKIRIVSLMELVETIEEETADGMTVHGHSHEEEEETEYDEHVWTSPANVIPITQGICDALCEKDEPNAADYRANLADYTLQLEELDEAFADVVENGMRKEVIFGDRFPFLYFVRRYDLAYSAAFPGCAEQTEPSAATLAYLIDRVREDEVPVVFKVEMSSGSVADAIAETTGAKVMTFYACHGISAEDMARGETYVSLMWKNVEALKTALN